MHRHINAIFWILVCGMVFVVSTEGRGQDREHELREMQSFLTRLAESHRGQVAFVVHHLETDESFGFNQDEPMSTASLIKVAVMAEAYRQAAEGTIDLDQMVRVDEGSMVPGSGILTSHFSSGTQISVRDLIQLMIVFSDNTATNLVLDQIGMKATANTMEAWGFAETKIHSKVFRRDTSVFPERSARFGLGSTTAHEMAELLGRIAQGELLGTEYDERMYRHLLACEDDSKCAKGLPSGTLFANKTGAISNVRCDGGIIESTSGKIVVVVLTNENSDQSWGDSNEAERLCATIAGRVFEFFSESSSDAESETELLVGSTGELVENLQRTLNKRLEPSPALAIDGDFGPNTEEAVRRFQESRDLEPTGVMNRDTWSELGVLITTDDPVPPPEVVNQRQLDRDEADELDGLPFVTCGAWTIVDAANGETLFESNSLSTRDIASTTKIMTALVVLEWAQSREGALAQTVTFSRRADETIGSTSGLRAGEMTTVEELLYGLLLPSGNDASVALAEHVGRSMLSESRDDERLANESGDSASSGVSDQQAYDRFILEMNEKAEQLQMEHSSFRNPHGLTEQEHQSSAHDLAVLARAALEHELFREIVNTPERGARVDSQSGYQRDVLWKNTNRLLGITGYAGVKTGTTRAAGACLVALAERDDRQIIIVILGATSSDARYTDARNLARYAFGMTPEIGASFQ